MKYLKLFENYTDDSEVLVTIGDYELTRGELEKEHKRDITSYYGSFSEDNIQNALYTLHDIAGIYNKGGKLYRVVWLKDINDLDKEDLGHHWVSYKSDVDNIVQTFSQYDYDDEYGGDPYVITAETPPANVKIPFEYFKNLDECEVLVIDDKLLKFIGIEKY